MEQSTSPDTPIEGTHAKERPSQEPTIEIESEKENRGRSRRAMPRGTLSNNTLTPIRNQQTAQLDGNPNSTTSSGHRYETRTAKHGRAADTYAKYDMKYHVMDEVVRPKRAAKRRGRSRSESVSTFRGEESEAEEQSLPSSAGALESEQEPDSDEESDTEDAPPVREPDPRASRRSKRSQAKKHVNYSRKHHPQDRHIPGFQHAARRLKRSRAPVSKGKGPQKKRRVDEPSVTRTSHSPSRSISSDGIDDLVEETLRNISQIPTSSALETLEKTAQEAFSMIAATETSTMLQGNSNTTTDSSITLQGDSHTSLGRLEDYLPHDPVLPNEPIETHEEASRMLTFADLEEQNILSDQGTISTIANSSSSSEV